MMTSATKSEEKRRDWSVQRGVDHNKIRVNQAVETRNRAQFLGQVPKQQRKSYRRLARGTKHRQHARKGILLGECRFKHLARLLQYRVDLATAFDRFVGVEAILICAISLAFWRTATGAMKTANSPAAYSRSLARLASAFRHSRAAWCVLESVPVHGVVFTFLDIPPPPWTLPTIACPPSFTLTCCTVTFCSPPVLYRFKASTWVANVLASLFIMFVERSCCGTVVALFNWLAILIVAT